MHDLGLFQNKPLLSLMSQTNQTKSKQKNAEGTENSEYLKISIGQGHC